MSLLSQVLALVLSFPAVGLLLYVLTAAERWALSDPSRDKPPRHHRAARSRRDPGPGGAIGKALATSPRIAKVAFTGETVTGRLIMQYAAQNIIPVTLELGGRSPNVFFADVMASDDEYLDKAVEGLVLYAFNKGEVCTCPSRALIAESIYDEFMARCLDRIAKIRQGNPLDTQTMLGPQNSAQQLDKIGSYVDIGHAEGAEVLTGGKQPDIGGEFAGGTSTSPPCSRGTTRCGCSRRRSSARCSR